MQIPPYSISRHGTVAWACTGRKRSGKCGLWLVDLKKGWVELAKPGDAVPPPLVDNAGMVYDAKRDRLLLAVTPWGKPGDGSMTAFYFRDRRLPERILEQPGLDVRPQTKTRLRGEQQPLGRLGAAPGPCHGEHTGQGAVRAAAWDSGTQETQTDRSTKRKGGSSAPKPS